MGQPNDLTAQTIKTTITTLAAFTGTTSAAFDCQGGTLVGIILPGTVASTTLDIQVSDSLTGTFVPVYNAAGTKFSLASLGTNRAIYIDPVVTGPFRYIRFVMGTSETAFVIRPILRALS